MLLVNNAQREYIVSWSCHTDLEQKIFFLHDLFYVFHNELSIPSRNLVQVMEGILSLRELVVGESRDKTPW